MLPCREVERASQRLHAASTLQDWVFSKPRLKPVAAFAMGSFELSGVLALCTVCKPQTCTLGWHGRCGCLPCREPRRWQLLVSSYDHMMSCFYRFCDGCLCFSRNQRSSFHLCVDMLAHLIDASVSRSSEKVLTLPTLCLRSPILNSLAREV